jgi:hypothetical protein
VTEGSAWFDVNNDGRPDLVVPRSGPNPPAVYWNEGGGAFSLHGGFDVQDVVQTAVADYDNNGFLDVVFHPNLSGGSVQLFRNNGDATFTHVTTSGILPTLPPGYWLASFTWGDYDNDGFLDAFAGLGCYPPPPNNNGACDAGRGLLYHNNGDGTFTAVTEGDLVTTPLHEPLSASWGDYDNDGFLDLIVPDGGFWPTQPTSQLFHNDGNANAWLAVELVGTVSNRSGIGARIRVHATYRGAPRWQMRAVMGTNGGAAQSTSLRANFGLADATAIDTVRVEWPSGIVQELHGVAPRQFLTITEPNCAGEQTGCLTAQRSALWLKHVSDDTKDKLRWGWRKGQTTTLSDFGVPTGTTAYTLCIYSGTSSALAYTIPGGANWTAIGHEGFRYRDKTAANDGIRRIVLKSGADGKSTALVTGIGVNLPDPTLPFTLPVTAQLVTSSTNVCFTSDINAAKKNTMTLFKAKAP